jgi:hypothetical protein
MERDEAMSTTEIIQQVQKLPPSEVFELSQWLREYEASLWDQQIEADIRAGKLDRLAKPRSPNSERGTPGPFRNELTGHPCVLGALPRATAGHSRFGG